MAMKDYEMTQQSYEEFLDRLVERFPPERRLRGLTPAQRLAGLSAEEILNGLSAEEILNALPPEVRELLAKKMEH
jgi:hypothetical protein